jgi:type III secretory pathway component EscS
MCDFYLSTIFFHIGISTLIGIIIGLVYYLFTKNKSNSISLGIKVSIIVVSAYPIFMFSDNSITGDSSIYIFAIYFSLFPLLFLSSKNRKYKISICVLVPTALLLLYFTSDGYARYYNEVAHSPKGCTIWYIERIYEEVKENDLDDVVDLTCHMGEWLETLNDDELKTFEQVREQWAEEHPYKSERIDEFYSKHRDVIPK